MEIQQLLIGAQEALTARRVFGEPVRVDDVTLVPVAVVRGGGGAFGRNTEKGGIGFGINGRPAGVYVVRGDDVRWRPALDINRIVLGGQVVAIVAILALRAVLLHWGTRDRT
jgi:uncharacterized spore protein YtfJ